MISVAIAQSAKGNQLTRHCERIDAILAACRGLMPAAFHKSAYNGMEMNGAVLTRTAYWQAVVIATIVGGS